MQHTDKRVNEYIEKSADFARPILEKLRILVHTACPEVKEVMKWSFPNFEYKDNIVCNMASFKQHCSFGFWLSAQMDDPAGILTVTEKSAMGNLGKLKLLSDLPPDNVVVAYVKNAMELIDNGKKVVRKTLPAPEKSIEIPGYFTSALSENEAAKKHFEAFPYSHKKEYLQWITEAKTETTRNKRITTAIGWIADGKGRNWKYERQ